MAKFQAIVRREGGGLAGEAEGVEDGVHEEAGAVAGEGAAGAVGSVGARCETKDEDAGAGVAKAGDGFGPVDLVYVGSAAGCADGFSIEAETLAAGAFHDVTADGLEDRRQRCWGRGHWVR